MTDNTKHLIEKYYGGDNAKKSERFTEIVLKYNLKYTVTNMHSAFLQGCLASKLTNLEERLSDTKSNAADFWEKTEKFLDFLESDFSDQADIYDAFDSLFPKPTNFTDE
jgi:hypothetical protein